MIAILWDMWDEGWDGRFMLLLLGVCVALVAFIPYAIYHDHQVGVACRERGGEMVVVGHHFVPITTMVGKVPITTLVRTAEHACTVPKLDAIPTG